MPGASFCGCQYHPRNARQRSYLEVEALGADHVLGLAAVMCFLALFARLLLHRLGRGALAVVGAHVAEAIAAGALAAGGLEQHILVGLDLDLLVLEGRQDAGAAAGERLFLVLEDALWRRRVRLRSGGRGLLGGVGFAPLGISVALVLFRGGAGLVGLSFHCAHGVRREVSQRLLPRVRAVREKSWTHCVAAGANPSAARPVSPSTLRVQARRATNLSTPFSPSIRAVSTAAPIT